MSFGLSAVEVACLSNNEHDHIANKLVNQSFDLLLSELFTSLNFLGKTWHDYLMCEL